MNIHIDEMIETLNAIRAEHGNIFVTVTDPIHASMVDSLDGECPTPIRRLAAISTNDVAINGEDQIVATLYPREE